MRVAIIPARGGSKRIPRKNIKLFYGKPIISYAVDAALAANLFDEVIVSTDDIEIAEIAKLYGAKVPFIRPQNLADDHTQTVPVISHAIQTCIDMGWTLSVACCIYPSVPLISIKDLQNGYYKLINSKANYVFPVTKFPSPIQRALRRNIDDSIVPFYPEHLNSRSQDLEPAYFDVGQFYWGRTISWLNKCDIHLNSETFVIPEWRVVDIDDLDDWQRAELFYATLLERNML